MSAADILPFTADHGFRTCLVMLSALRLQDVLAAKFALGATVFAILFVVVLHLNLHENCKAVFTCCHVVQATLLLELPLHHFAASHLWIASTWADDEGLYAVLLQVGRQHRTSNRGLTAWACDFETVELVVNDFGGSLEVVDSQSVAINWAGFESFQGSVDAVLAECVVYIIKV